MNTINLIVLVILRPLLRPVLWMMMRGKGYGGWKSDNPKNKNEL